MIAVMPNSLVQRVSLPRTTREALPIGWRTPATRGGSPGEGLQRLFDLLEGDGAVLVGDEQVGGGLVGAEDE
jgi:hypothetical protein